LVHDHPYSMDATGWLVRVGTDGKSATKTFQELVPGAPAPTDKCRIGFNTRDFPRPWPPPDGASRPTLGPLVPCLAPRPAMNPAPAVGADGTIFLVSRAHGAERTTFIVAVKPDLTPKWATSLVKVFNDGCGVNGPPIDGDADHLFDCRIGATMGVDP